MVKDATKEPLLRPSSSSSSSDSDAPNVQLRQESPPSPAKPAAKKRTAADDEFENPKPPANDNGLMLMGILVAILVAGATYLVFNIKPEGPVVELGYSNYLGKWDEERGYSVFYGVKYAAPATGANRFRAPLPPVSTHGEGYINVTVPAKRRCPQTTIPKLDLTGKNSKNFDIDLWAEPTEDCLDMTIYTPLDMRKAGTKQVKEGEEEKKEPWEDLEAEDMPEGGYPVMVVVHGGGYGFGSRDDLDPPRFIDLSKRGIVTVMINYRLGAFGFLSSEEVKKDGDLNVGLLDQRAAFQWVQKYIHHFGGNPSRVTIYGQSSGGSSAVHHMLSQDPEAKNLFQNVILSSPYSNPLYNYNDRRPIQLFKKFAQLAGCEDATDKMACLRKAPLETLVKANLGTVNEVGDWGDFGFYPVKEDSEPQYRGKGFIIPETLSKALHPDRVQNNKTTFNGNRLLVTHMPNEGFLFSSPLVNDANFADTLLAHLPELTRRRGIESILSQYPAENFQNAKARLDAITGDVFFNCVNYWLADAFSASKKANDSVWEEQFMIPPYIHGLDSAFTFRSPVTAKNRQTFEEHSSAIVAFVKNGNPNDMTGVGPFAPRKEDDSSAPEKEVWRAWYPWNRVEKVVGVGAAGNTLTMVMGVEDQWGGRCDFWRDMVEKTNL